MILKDKDKYIEICLKYKSSVPLFYTPDWLDTVCNDNWEVLLYKDGNEIIAAFPYHKKSKYLLDAIIMPQLTPYLGIWFFKECDEEQHRIILQKMIASLPNVFYYNIALCPTFSDVSCFQKNGFYHKPRVTHIIKNSSIDDVRKNFNNTTKAHIRSAAKTLNVIMDDNVESLYKSIESSFNKYDNELTISISFIKNIYNNKIFNPRIYHAIDSQNKIHASVMTVEDVSTVYHILAGRDTQAARGAVALIINTTLEDSMKKGKNYDFEGSSIPSIATFFRSFGAEVHTFGQVYRSRFKFTDWVLYRIGKF